MAYVILPNGAGYPIREGESPQDALRAALTDYPEAFGFAPSKSKEDTSGFTAAASATMSRIAGEAALTAGKLGILSQDEAEKRYKQKVAEAEARHKPTEKGWTEDFGLKFRELAGGSAPYIVAPLAAGAAATVGAPLLGASAGIAGLAGAGAGFAASAGQFTGSNLAAQVDTGKTLEEASFAKAALTSIPQALIDTLSLRMAPGIGRLFGAVGKEITEDTAKALANQTLKQIALDYGKAGLGTMTREGFTEVAQQALERAQAGLSITDEDARKEYFDQFLGGAILGGALAIPGRAVERGEIKSKGRALEQERLGKEQAAAAEEQAKADAELAAKRQTPEYLDNLVAQYNVAQQQLAKTPLPQKPKKPKNATPEQEVGYEDALKAYEEAKTARDAVLEQVKPVFQEYKERLKDIRTLRADRMQQAELEGGAGPMAQMNIPGMEKPALPTPPEQLALPPEQRGMPPEQVQGGVPTLESLQARQKELTDTLVRAKAANVAPVHIQPVTEQLSAVQQDIAKIKSGKPLDLTPVQQRAQQMQRVDLSQQRTTLADMAAQVRKQAMAEGIEPQQTRSLLKQAAQMDSDISALDKQLKPLGGPIKPLEDLQKSRETFVNKLETAKKAKATEPVINKLLNNIAKIDEQIALYKPAAAEPQASIDLRPQEARQADMEQQGPMAQLSIPGLSEPVLPTRKFETAPAPAPTYFEADEEINKLKLMIERQYDKVNNADFNSYPAEYKKLDDMRTQLGELEASRPEKPVGKSATKEDLAAAATEREATLAKIEEKKAEFEQFKKDGKFEEAMAARESVDTLQSTLQKNEAEFEKRFPQMDLIRGGNALQAYEDALAEKIAAGREQSAERQRKADMALKKAKEDIQALASRPEPAPYVREARQERQRDMFERQQEPARMQQALAQFEGESPSGAAFETATAERELAAQKQAQAREPVTAQEAARFEAEGPGVAAGQERVESERRRLEEDNRRSLQQALDEITRFEGESPAMRTSEDEELRARALLQSLTKSRQEIEARTDAHNRAMERAQESKRLAETAKTAEEKRAEVARMTKEQRIEYGKQRREEIRKEKEIAAERKRRKLAAAEKAAPKKTEGAAATSEKTTEEKSAPLAAAPKKEDPEFLRKELSDMSDAELVAAQKYYTDEGRHRAAALAERELNNRARERAKEPKEKPAALLTETDVTQAEKDVAEAQETHPDLIPGTEEAVKPKEKKKFNKRPTTAITDDVREAVEEGRTLDVLKAFLNSANPVHREVAEKLLSMMTSIKRVPKLQVQDNLTYKGDPAEGLYYAQSNRVVMDRAHLTEEALLHEFAHATTILAIKDFGKTSGVGNLTAAQHKAAARLNSLFKQARGHDAFKGEYGIESLEEFVAEVLSNRDLRTKLDKHITGFFQKVINTLMRLVGLEPRTMSREALDAAFDLFQPPAAASRNVDGAALMSITRGIFPSVQPKASASVPQSVVDTVNSLVGSKPSVWGNIVASATGLKIRQDLVDNWASTEAMVKLGVEKGAVTDAQALQLRFLMRVSNDTNRLTTQALKNGVQQLVKDPSGARVLTSVAGPNAIDMVKALDKSKLGNQQFVENLFTNWLGILRAERDGIGYEKMNFGVDKDNKPILNAQKAAEIKNLVNSDPATKAAFEEARKIYREYNRNLLDLLVQAGVMSKEKAASLIAGDYVPYYRVSNGAVELHVGPKRITIGSIIDQPQLKELVGGDDKILPVFSGMVQNTSLLVTAAVRNMQTHDVSNVLQNMGFAKIIKGEAPRSDKYVVRYKYKGENYYARLDSEAFPPNIPAELLIAGLQGIKTTVPKAVEMLGIPTRLLRKGITRMPTYIYRQLIRDPIHAWLTTGGDFSMVFDTYKQFFSAWNKPTESIKLLEDAGAISSMIHTGDKEDLARALRDINSSKGGLSWNSAMAWLDEKGMNADAATRAAVYNNLIKKGVPHIEAVLGAAESMNFSRRGTSASLMWMSTLAPFVNAQIQGLDAVYRAFRGDTSFEARLNASKVLRKRLLLLAGCTMAYMLAMQDDDAYKNATANERAMNFFVPVPGIGTLRVPIPFELGMIGKALPELALNTAFGDTKLRDAGAQLRTMLLSSIPGDLPTAIKPLIELRANHTFFTDAPIESQRELGMVPSERYRAGTPELAKMLGSSLLSPVQIEHLVRSYTGGVGTLLMSLPDILLRPLRTPENVESPARRLSELPVLSSLFQPETGRGIIDAVYKDVESYQQVSNTYKSLVSSGNRAEAADFANKYANEIAMASVGGGFRQQMGELANVRRQITSAPNISAEDKQKYLESIKKMEIQLATQIRDMAARKS